MSTEPVPKKKIEQFFIPPWTEKGFTKDCECGQKINYLSKVCPYCNKRGDE